MSLFLCVAEHKAGRHAELVHRSLSPAIAPATGAAKAARHAKEPVARLYLVRGQRRLYTTAIYAARVELQGREIPMAGEPPEQLKERATTIPRASNSGTQWIGSLVDARTTAAAPRLQQTPLLRRMVSGCRWRVSGPEGRGDATAGTESGRRPWKKRRWHVVGRAVSAKECAKWVIS
jgi:hypothetical protein